ncbi:MAG: Asparagine synthetase [candidate division Zixibacteria bacterium RBG-1]|nr:MAG: Asparagine synthetase [candidate division Zixibacteria bacterium RBG-1]OGC85337.1 MAG: asparagine synthase (glutamine-hydrolyzing) [candidate division Zixibacteria bacterium RBG_19FT_COMBO_42_43]
MCGIAGIVSREGFDPKLLISMTHLVTHRGPDGYGFAFFGPEKNSYAELIHNEARLPSLQNSLVGLGHRRLAILDITARGNQPMHSEDGALYITYNGEVYNYLEIRKELEELGHSFKTRTDTEVVLHAYQQWGDECLKRFNGMWSFAIWNRNRRRLFCARDRFGVKPLYYYFDGARFIFASEIKQILQCPDISRRANDSVVFDYLEQGLADHSAETFFQGIYQLPGGHFLILDLSLPTPTPVIRRYWELPIRQNIDLSEEEACEELRARLTKAVTLRMRSDVPVGSCLSGGLDSSAIVCLAKKKILPQADFHTFSSCFEDKFFDEREYIAEVIAATQSKSHLIFPGPAQFWKTFERLIWYQDEPVGGIGVYAQWCVMEAARREGIPVLLDGQGGDETLCGYRKFYYFYLWQLLRKGDPKCFSEALLWLHKGGMSLWAWSDAKRYLPSSFVKFESLARRVCQPVFQRKYRDRICNLGAGSDIRERQRADLVKYSIPALLRYEDRNSMAHSVEARVPFLDYELAEFLVNCPLHLKMGHGWSKWILRQGLRGILPEAIRLRRTKMGFNTPQRNWIRSDLKEMIRAVFASSGFHMERFIIPTNVREEFDKFCLGRHDSLSDTELFRVLNLELWARVYGVC